ncbi:MULTISPECIES: hypothetical protein [unclassified Rhizobium]|uniref:hypothetical protein n=1 Tax=unclassified Rhizobium TaxID=2613769 RepID=UPI0016169D2A|nr:MULTISPECIES: hypothetical protein [unclassified Rhizobium]MBB3545340.1 hypothetical protein [Rhizobium sp. BK399]MCS3744100.1 hypothetical protein [Rhizobium sp. BK661]MCS4096055.1 hypothetical protein [Rhizobium sp. BK176]
MPGEQVEFSKSSEGARIREIWKEAAQKIPASPSAAKAPFLGINLRINLIKALQATWETGSVAVKVLAAAHTTFDPVTWLGIGVEAVAAVKTVVAALVQQLSAINYITYVMLAQSPNGVTEATLKQNVEKFVRDPKLFQFAWHLGMTEAKAAQALQVIEQPNWITTTMEKLSSDNMAERRGELWFFQERNFTLRGEE